MVAKRVLLVRPPCRGDEKFEDLGVIYPPFSLVGMATFLISKGVPAKVVDFEAEPFSAERFREIIRREKPSLIGISVVSLTFRSARDICAIAKAAGIRCVLGGPHPTALPEDTLRGTAADAVILGEGEETLLELAGRKDWSKVRGIVLRKGKRLVRTPPRPLLKDLDILPFPDRRLVDYKGYLRRGRRWGPRRSTPLVASRGCPYSCAFCQSPRIWGKRWRARSVPHVIAEIRDVVSLGYNHILAYDDIFGLDERWLREFCRSMVRTGLSGKIAWTALTRVDLVKKSNLSLMKAAGCREICLGVESGSQRILDSTRKGITVGQTERAFAIAKEAGLLTLAYVIVGNLDEGADDIEMTWRLIRKLDPDTLHVAAFSPLPGTPAYEEAVARGLYRPSADGFDKHGYRLDASPCGNGVLTSDQIIRMRNGLIRRFYMRPSCILRRFLRPEERTALMHDVHYFLAVLARKAFARHESRS